jgi:phosphoglycerol transferase MdoB-like AlkP superfamily enzyme
MQRVKIVLRLIILLLAVYFLLRIVFGFTYFRMGEFSFSQHLRLFYWGTRLDFAGLFYINIPFFIFYFFLVPFLPPGWQTRSSVILFSLINLPLIALNFIDLVYFRYNLRRSTVDLFYIFGDSVRSFGGLFRQYWFVVLAFIIVSVVFVKIVTYILHRYKINRPEKWYFKWLAPLAFLVLSFFVARGWDSRPIVPPTALLYVDPARQPFVNNSTLNLLYSYLRAASKLEKKNYFADPKLDSLYSIRRHYVHERSFEKRNVVVFILESFANSFFTSGRDRAQTPFFDSLMNKSIVCSNAFANGHESVQGLLAILGSIPSFLDEPLFLSNYNSVPFRGIGSVLKEEGYNTSFFLGAEYDHFNFAKLCRMTGIDDYYSKESYGYPEHHDGNWGISDEFFFPYFAAILSQKKQPFFSVLFNLSSHPPFTIPVSHKNNFSIPGQRPQLNSITYVDHCFRQLFDKIKTQPWFSNTLFVFTADHTYLFDYDRDRSYLYKALQIPLFIYDPQQPVQAIIPRTVQQLDIVPSILDKLGYSKPFMSFGQSIFSAEQPQGGFSIYKGNQGYQLAGSGMLTGFDDRSGKTIYHYNYLTDTTLSKNLADSGDPIIEQKTDLIKAILQRYNNSLIDQKLLIRD